MKTTYGAIEGQLESVYGVELAAFRGVPYAAPPLGRTGRWKPPVAPKPWSGVLNTTQDQAACYQFLGSSAVDGAAFESEDCLYVNVYTSRVLTKSAMAAGPVPVFFWIYGGGLVIGDLEAYGPLENLLALANGEVCLRSWNGRGRASFRDCPLWHCLLTCRRRVSRAVLGVPPPLPLLFADHHYCGVVPAKRPWLPGVG